MEEKQLPRVNPHDQDIATTHSQDDTGKTITAQLSQVSNSPVKVDGVAEFHQGKKKINQRGTRSKTLTLPPSKKLKRDKTSEGSLSGHSKGKVHTRSLTKSDKTIVLAIPTPNQEGNPLRKTNIFCGPSENSANCFTPSLCQVKNRSIADMDISGNHSTIPKLCMSPLSNIKEEEQHESSKTQCQTLQKNPVHSSPHSTKGLGAHDITQQKGGIEKEKTVLGTREQPDDVFSGGPEEGVSHGGKLNMKLPLREASTDDPKISTGLRAHTSDELTLDNGNLPFVKICPFWKDVESNEFFHSLPQCPHFRPLQEEDEFLREGRALGYMLSFVNTVDKITKAQIDEPKCNLENYISALFPLEANGFNVHLLQTRMQDLLRIKDNHVQFEGELKEVDEKIIEEKHEQEAWNTEVDKKDEEIKSLEESITQLKKKQAKISTEKRSKNSSIVKLQRSIQQTEEDIKGIKLGFHRVAAAPCFMLRHFR